MPSWEDTFLTSDLQSPVVPEGRNTSYQLQNKHVWRALVLREVGGRPSTALWVTCIWEQEEGKGKQQLFASTSRLNWQRPPAHSTLQWLAWLRERVPYFRSAPPFRTPLLAFAVGKSLFSAGCCHLLLVALWFVWVSWADALPFLALPGSSCNPPKLRRAD